MIKGLVRQDDTDGRYFVNILRLIRMAMDYEKEPRLISVPFASTSINT